VLSIRSNSKSASTASSTPPGKIPQVYVSLANVSATAEAAVVHDGCMTVA
jgi:hypothetical protein